MTNKTKIISASLLLGILIYIVDAWMDSTIFYGGSFLDLLIFEVPANEIYTRSLIILMTVLCGLVIANFTEKSLASSKAKINSEAELSKLISSTSAIPWKFDIGSRKFVYIGELIEQMTGYPPQAWVDFDYWISRIHPDDKKIAVDFFLSVTDKGTDYESVYRMLTADDQTIWVRDIAFIETVDNEPAFLKGFFFNITKIMETKAENKQLEAQLRQSQKMEALGQLAGGVAHDFNNFLTTIVGYSELSMMTIQNDDPLRDNITEILAAANKAASVTKSLLAFSRKQVLNPKPLNINNVVDGMKKLLDRILGENIMLKIKMPEQNIIVKADAGQLEQVIINMAANAKAAIANTGAFTIELSKVFIDNNVLKNYSLSQAGYYASLSFSDNGTGMAAETLEKIFEPFYTTKDKDQGTGLGLSIVHGIVKQHNGYINAYSEEGYGTTFKILLPCTKSPIQDEAPQESFEIRGGNEAVLIAEDEDAVRKLLSEILATYGYKIILAKDGVDAVKKFKDNRDQVKLVILDVIMPSLNGKEALEAILQISPEIKALFVSGYSPDIIHQKGLILKDADFLSKPILPNELLHRVREILDRDS